MVMAWHGDGGGFTQAVYFTSEDAARQGEKAMQDDPTYAEFMALLDTDAPMNFWDLRSPEVH
jgi:hypothetical protein